MTMTDEENSESVFSFIIKPISDFFSSSDDVTLYTDIETLTHENTVKFITGEQSLDDYDAFVEQLHTYNIDRCIELKQAALDRYNAR